MSTQHLTPERRRSVMPATFLCLLAFVAMLAPNWWVNFVMIQPLQAKGGLLAYANSTIMPLVHFIDEFFTPYFARGPVTPDALVALQSGDLLAPRWVVVLLASLAFALPIARWRWQVTPRRIVAKWHGRTIPPWSEGRDAIRNAKALQAGGGRPLDGLAITPKLRLSSTQEAKSLIVVGMPGSGKTVVFWNLIRDLLKRKPRPRLIVHDYKGDFTESWPDDDVVLLAADDERSWGWAIGRDLINTKLVREFASAIIPLGATNDETWGKGAREILFGIIETLRAEHRTSWDWPDLKAALELPDEELKEFATRYHPGAKRLLALEDGVFTRTAQSYLSTLVSQLYSLIGPLAETWGSLTPEYKISLREWLAGKGAAGSRKVLILKQAPDAPAMTRAWLAPVINLMITTLLGSRSDQTGPAKKAKAPPDVWFILDEFPQLGFIEDFQRLPATGRSLGLRCIIGVQNLGQLKDTAHQSYADDLLGLIGNRIILGLNAGESAKLIADLGFPLQEVEIIKTTTDKNGRIETTKTVEQMQVLTQGDLAELKTSQLGVEGYLIFDETAMKLTWAYRTPKAVRPKLVTG